MSKNVVNIRQLWLDYYQNLGFKLIPSAPLVHPSFPMSFNMSAGLVQLDPKIRSPKKVKPGKQVLIQKCFRHFDIDKVGDDTHLTFFEMPGAFEIVDFDEVKTIEMIWNFLSQILHLDPQKLWITSFHKDKVEDKVISQPPILLKYLKSLVGNRLILSDKRTNLWMQGGGIEFTDNMRLVGPQVEFFYETNCHSRPDLIGINSSGNLNNITIQQSNNETMKFNPLTHPKNFLEIGNTIFIKYYIDYTNMTLKTLLNPSIESVIGLERTAAIVENFTSNSKQLSCHSERSEESRKESNATTGSFAFAQDDSNFSVYSSFFFQPIFGSLPSPLPNPLLGKERVWVKSKNQESRILINHLKSLLFILSETEILPGRNGRSRIIRTLIRQLLTSCYVLFPQQLNNLTMKQLLSALLDSIITMYKSTYPELKKGKKLTLKTIFDHEKVFLKTLETGKRKIKKFMEENKIKKLTRKHKIYFQQQFGYPVKLLPYIQYEP